MPDPLPTLPSTLRRSLSLYALPIILLAFATLFFGGRIGWWSDDYFHNQTNPVTGAIDALTIRRGFFLRPLFYLLVPAVTTLSWHAQWPAHLLQILSHAGVVAALFRLMLSLGAARAAAAAASLLYMLYPGHFEALFWAASLPTSLSTLLMLGIFFAMIAFARGGVGWWIVPLMPLATFTLCCLNEQPAAGLAALPILYWAARAFPPPAHLLTSSPAHLSSPHPTRAPTLLLHLTRALLPTALCLAAFLFYTYLVVHDPNKPPGSRGSPETMVQLADLRPRLAHFLDVLWRRLILLNFADGAVRTGLDQLRAAPLIAGLWLAALFTAAVPWLYRWTTRPPDHTPAPLRVLPVGMTIFLTGWLPILVVAVYDPDSRTRYWPCIGSSLVLATLLTAALRPISRPYRVCTGFVLLYILFISALALIGVQTAFRARYAKDLGEAAQLRAVVPNPDPLTFFIPVRIDETTLKTGSPVFDTHFRSVWEFPWTAPKFILSAYQRPDVRCGYYRHWTPNRPVIGADESGINFADRLGPAFPRIEGAGSRIPWDRALPFTIDAAGRLHLITTITFPAPDGADSRIPVRQLPADTPPLEWRLPRA